MKRHNDYDDVLRTMHKKVLKVLSFIVRKLRFLNFQRARFVVKQTLLDTIKHHPFARSKLYY